jgi:hypothetical protein
VAAEFDLNLIPFYRIKGQEWPQLPGLMAATPPKRAARGREDDQLLIYLTLSGNTPYTSAEYSRIMSQLSERFYQTAGSLTSAIRATADALNQFLLNRNLTTTGKGQYIIGRLILGVLRGGQFVFAQSGPTHVFHLTGDECRQVHDPQIEGRGLGIGQTTPIYFAQADLHHGDLLVLCSNLPAGWDSALLAERKGAPESLRRKLFSVTGEDLSAVLVQAQVGKGNMNTLKGGTRPSAEKPVQTPAVDAPASSPLQAKRPASTPQQDPAPTSNPEQSPAAPVRHASKVDSGRPASRFAHIIAGTSPAAPDGTTGPESPVQSTNKNVTARSQPVQNTVAGSHRPVPTQTPARPAGRPGRFISPRQGNDIPEIKRPIDARRRRKVLVDLPSLFK